MEFKNTLLMPKTNFEMRGNLINKEPALVKKWKDVLLTPFKSVKPIIIV